MPRLICKQTSCCLCLSLKAGCKIIGVISAFFCLLKFVLHCRILIKLHGMNRSCSEDHVWSLFEDNNCPHKRFVKYVLNLLDILIVVYGFIGSVLLLYGIKTRRPKLFLSWLIFCGLVICIKFTATILRWQNVSLNVFVILLWCYNFIVVQNYQWQLLDELTFPVDECPVIVETMPQESHVQVSIPAQQSEASTDTIKDDPPPPYPGLPVVPSTQSIESESQPPPYSAVISSNFEGPRVQMEDPCSSPRQEAEFNPPMRNVS